MLIAINDDYISQLNKCNEDQRSLIHTNKNITSDIDSTKNELINVSSLLHKYQNEVQKLKEDFRTKNEEITNLNHINQERVMHNKISNDSLMQLEQSQNGL